MHTLLTAWRIGRQLKAYHVADQILRECQCGRVVVPARANPWGLKNKERKKQDVLWPNKRATPNKTIDDQTLASSHHPSRYVITGYVFRLQAPYYSKWYAFNRRGGYCRALATVAINNFLCSTSLQYGQSVLRQRLFIKLLAATRSKLLVLCTSWRQCGN